MGKQRVRGLLCCRVVIVVVVVLLLLLVDAPLLPCLGCDCRVELIHAWIIPVARAGPSDNAAQPHHDSMPKP